MDRTCQPKKHPSPRSHLQQISKKSKGGYKHGTRNSWMTLSFLPSFLPFFAWPPFFSSSFASPFSSCNFPKELGGNGGAEFCAGCGNGGSWELGSFSKHTTVIIYGGHHFDLGLFCLSFFFCRRLVHPSAVHQRTARTCRRLPHLHAVLLL